MKIQGKVILDDHRVYNIPNDIIGEILLRLPAKSLLRFRWACKYWFDLISSRDSSFVKMHLHHSTITNNNITTNNNNDEILMMMRRSVSNSSSYIVLSISDRNVIDDSYKLLQCSLDYNDATGVGDVSSEVSIALPFDRPAGWGLKILGSCNGLILLYQYQNETLCIWNPCTKEYKILPPLPDMNGLLKNTAEYQRRCYGFGYDHTTDDYKVIIRNMYCTFDGGSFPGYTIYSSDVQVYTLGTNSWRNLMDGGPDPGRLFNGYQTEGMFVNGAIYWINLKYRDIVSFDIGKEKFRHVSEIPNLTDSWICMEVFEGSLCVVINDQLESQIWVMKQEYAVNNNNNNESLWTKLLAIPHLGNFHMFPLTPLRFTRNGEILMLTDDYDYLRLYDPKNSKFETICRICEHPDDCYFTYVYTESLVSLNSTTYMGRERMKQAKKNQLNKEQEHA